MQQACVDDVLMANYSDVDNTKTLAELTNQALNDVIKYKCEPFDCNGNGQCIDGECVCNTGTSDKSLYLKHLFKPLKHR